MHSQAAYLNVVDASAALASEFSCVETWNESHCSGYVAIHSDYIVVAIAGTNEAADWKTNTTKQHVPWNDGVHAYGVGQVHQGFFGYSQVVLRNVLRIFKSLGVDPETTIYVAGHSLGGASATIVSAMLRKLEWSVARCITFGAPRCLNSTAAVEYPIPLWRVQNAGDPVPFVPFHFLKSDYSHVGELLYQGVKHCIDTEIGSLASRLWVYARTVATAVASWLEGGSFFTYLAKVPSHEVSEYIERLDGAIAFIGRENIGASL